MFVICEPSVLIVSLLTDDFQFVFRTKKLSS